MSDKDKKNDIDPLKIIDDLNLEPITPIKKRRKLPKIDWNVKRFQEARLKKTLFLLSLEENKKRQEMEKENNTLVSNDTEHIGDISLVLPIKKSVSIKTSWCSEEIFNPDLFGAYYSYDKMFGSQRKKLPIEGNDDTDYFEPFLSHRLYLMSCKQQFMIMTTVPDAITAKYCYRRLVLKEFAVPFEDVLMVFLNWGASLKILRKTGVNIANVQEKNTSQENNGGKLFPHNVECVLKYIQCFYSTWQTHEIVSLILLLISAALDKTLRRCYYLFIGALSRLLSRLDNTEILDTASLLIMNFKSMDILNAVFICVDLIPVSNNGDLLSTKASYGLLEIMLGPQFPVEEDCAWSVLDILVTDEREPESYFQHLYFVIKLVENITIKRLKTSKAKNVYFKNFTRLRASATKLESNIKYANIIDDFDNLHMIKEMLARLINHSQKIIVKTENKMLT